MFNVTLLFQLTAFQTICINVNDYKDEGSIYQICKFPEQYCDGDTGTCVSCIEECYKDSIPLACLATCKGKDLVKNLTANERDAIDPSCKDSSTTVDPAVVVLSLAVAVVITISIGIGLFQKRRYEKLLRKGMAQTPMIHAQERGGI